MDTLRGAGRGNWCWCRRTKFANPGHFVHTTRAVWPKETPGAVWANQFGTTSPTAAPISKAPRPKSGSSWTGAWDGFYLVRPAPVGRSRASGWV